MSELWNKYINKIKDINICPFNVDIVCNKAGVLRRITRSQHTFNYNKMIQEDSLLAEPILTCCQQCVYYMNYADRKKASK